MRFTREVLPTLTSPTTSTLNIYLIYKSLSKQALAITDTIKMRGGAQRSNLRPSNSRSNQNQRGGKDDANTEHLLAHEVDILKE